MPNPVVNGAAPEPEGWGRHFAPHEMPPPRDIPPARRAGRPAHVPVQVVVPSPASTPARHPENARPRGEVAVELPDWDLLPPVEFVRRHRGGA